MYMALSIIRSRFVFLLFFGLVSLSVYSQWAWKNPLPQGNNLNAACFINPSTVYAVGDVGTIINTADAGQTWTVKNMTDIRKNVYFESVCFPDENTGFAMDRYGFIYKTTDAGNTWDTVYYELDEYLNDLYFIDAQNGFVVCSGGKIIHTNNGGETWQFQWETTLSLLSSISFAGDNIGYIAGDKGIITKTIDSGSTWVSIHSDSTETYSSIHFITPNRGCVVGMKGVILNTSDGGQTWSETNLGDTVNLSTVSMFNSDTILATGKAITNNYNSIPQLLRSTDGGETWTVCQSSYEYFSPEAVSSTPEGTAYCVGNMGFISRSDNFGATWSEQSNILTEITHFGAGINDIDFPSGETGYAVAGGYEMPVGTILKTIDGGDSWLELDSSFYMNTFNAVDFPTTDTGFIAGNNIYCTKDGGNTWLMKHEGTWSTKILSLDFATPMIGVAVGQNGVFLRTTDMGQNWGQVSNIPNMLFSGICFADQSIGYATGNKLLLKTHDAGATWYEIPLTNTLRSIYFATSEIGYGVGSSGLIMKTEDGGNSWTELMSPTNESLYSVHFYDKDTGFVAGGTYVISAVILKTTDGGLHWTEQAVPTNYPITSIVVNDKCNAFSCSAGGGLFAQPGSDGYTNTHDFSGREITSKTISYPNPASESVTFKYILSEEAQVIMQIYSVNGKELQCILDCRQDRGTHSLSFATKHLSPGVYIYRLTYGEQIDTGKIVVR
jgi:photosystem II stability/assembly factor-like uncharacterized protein